LGAASADIVTVFNVDGSFAADEFAGAPPTPESRLRKFEQGDKWSFCLKSGDDRREQERP